MFDFGLSAHDQRQRGRLYASDAQGRTAALPILQRIKSRRIHSEHPIANRTTQSGGIKRVVLLLRAQGGETLSDRFVRHRGNPQPFDGTLNARLLHDPSLDQFAFLPGVTAVDNLFRRSIELADNIKLLLNAGVLLHPYTEALRDHRQAAQTPIFPVGRIVFRIF